jgi:hypothetical protein
MSANHLTTGSKQMTKFLKGYSGNPGGRPKKNAELVEAARERTQAALDTLESIMVNKRAPAAARVAAAREMLDRGWGRPTQDMMVEAELTATINAQVFVRPSTYEEWLKLKEMTVAASSQKNIVNIIDAAPVRHELAMIVDAREKSVG